MLLNGLTILLLVIVSGVFLGACSLAVAMLREHGDLA